MWSAVMRPWGTDDQHTRHASVEEAMENVAAGFVRCGEVGARVALDEDVKSLVTVGGDCVLECVSIDHPNPRTRLHHRRHGVRVAVDGDGLPRTLTASACGSGS